LSTHPHVVDNRATARMCWTKPVRARKGTKGRRDRLA
jgi:hypothetical protein